MCGGLGEYFGFDPVLFRVLFATASFFGGSGIVAYLLAWAAIPESGAERAPVDGWIAKLRQRRIPVWTVVIVLAILLCVASFSWWAPGPFVPVVIVVILVIVAVSRRELQGTRPAAAVDLTKGARPLPPNPATPSWVGDLRAWKNEAGAAARQRRRRALPIKLAALVGLGATLVVLAAIDAVTGVPMVTYFWASLGFVVVGLLVGIVFRRTPWSIATLLPLSLAGVIAFAGSHASLHDGVGQNRWRPAAVPAANYRLGLGQATLDLRALPAQSSPRTIHVTVGAGQVRVIIAKNSNVTVQANAHLGQLTRASSNNGFDRGYGGVGISRIYPAPADAPGAPVTVDVHLADGEIVLDRR